MLRGFRSAEGPVFSLFLPDRLVPGCPCTCAGLNPDGGKITGPRGFISGLGGRERGARERKPRFDLRHIGCRDHAGRVFAVGLSQRVGDELHVLPFEVANGASGGARYRARGRRWPGHGRERHRNDQDKLAGARARAVADAALRGTGSAAAAYCRESSSAICRERSAPRDVNPRGSPEIALHQLALRGKDLLARAQAEQTVESIEVLHLVSG